MGAKKRRLGLAALVTLATAATACGGSARHASAPASNVNVSSLVLPALDGGNISLAKLRGRVVVLHLFTTWSVAALVDVEQLKQLHKRGQKHVVVIGVALDPDGAVLVSPWRKAMTTTYPIALATRRLRHGKSVLKRIRRVPTTIVVNRFGRVRSRIERQLKPQELSRLVEAARRAR